MQDDFIRFTSVLDTPIFIRRSFIVAVEGFTYAPDHPHIPNHYGSFLTVTDGWWTTSFHVRETPDQIALRL